jgi:hypothetical protein
MTDYTWAWVRWLGGYTLVLLSVYVLFASLGIQPEPPYDGILWSILRGLCFFTIYAVMKAWIRGGAR